MPRCEVAPATAQDLADILRLLEACELPGAGVDGHLAHFFVARSNGALIGVVGVEPAGEYGLLRSLAVAPAARREGIARMLCARAAGHAAEQRMRALYLLTTTAVAFFSKLGFAAIPRHAAPDAIRETLEFSALCPDSAVVMTKPVQKANVLFLCTGNSARSILAEAYLNSTGRFAAYSAGSRPAGKVNALALELLARHGFATSGLRSKSWDEFAQAGAPRMDFVVTVCDSAAGESCPIWPGQPVKAHWSIPDPAAVRGSDEEKRQAFAAAFDDLRARIDRFLRLA